MVQHTLLRFIFRGQTKLIQMFFPQKSKTIEERDVQMELEKVYPLQ